MTEVPEGFPKLDRETRPWACKKGDPACTRKVPCDSCRGARSRRGGLRKQREARKALGITPKFAGLGGNEEFWNDPHFCDEVKSGAQVGPIATRFLAYENQALTNRSIGDTRPPRITAMPVGWGAEGIVMVRLSVWKSVIAPRMEAGQP